MGDPRHLAGQSYDVGTSTRDGVLSLFPFPSLSKSLDPYEVFELNSSSQQIIPRFLPYQNCDIYASRIQSFCDFDDFFCDSGTSLPVHESYAKYLGDARVFVNDLLES